MIARIKTTLAVYGKRFKAMQFNLRSKDWRRFPWPVHAVVSSLAIHHLDDTEKQILFEDIVSLLGAGGKFHNCGPDSTRDQTWNQFWRRKLGTERCVRIHSIWMGIFGHTIISVKFSGIFTRIRSQIPLTNRRLYLTN